MPLNFPTHFINFLTTSSWELYSSLGAFLASSSSFKASLTSPSFSRIKSIFSTLPFISSISLCKISGSDVLPYCYSVFLKISLILLPSIIIFTLSSSLALAQIQSHPLSQVFPMDVNLNLTGMNITNVNYVFFGNGSTDTYLFRSAANILRTDSHLVVTGGWVNSTNFNASNQICLGNICKTTWPSGALIGGSGSPGQVTFWTAADTISGDNNLFWDNTNKRLGIGTTSPQSLLHVVGTGNLLNVSTATTSLLFVNGTSGNVGIGTTAPGSRLEVVDYQSDGYLSSSNSVASPYGSKVIIRNAQNTINTSAFIQFQALEGTGTNNMWYVGIGGSAPSFGGPFVIGR
ncbi:MAG: hypothetical protein KQA38_02515, partial [Candidatus Aenigmarchaeota archaeon]|nr:hypothetical protein [Candidatus Aenigmarchaeota archaeon]